MMLSTVLILLASVVLATPDWTDCPQSCHCKWTAGKKSALCRNGSYTELPDNLYSDIQVIDLSGNFIDYLAKDAFKTVGLINLQKIYMRYANVQQIHRDAFRDLIILVELDLSHNQIRQLERGTFSGNTRLRMLDLSHNPIKILFEAQFPDLPHLRSLNLEHCQLENVHRNAFINIAGLELLNLKSNRLTTLSEATFMNFAHLKALNLDNNPWRCDCKLRGFRDWFIASNLRSMNLMCWEPNNLRQHHWSSLSADSFACAPELQVIPYNQVQAEAGGNVSFGCHVWGDPEPQVTWLYDGRPINHTWIIVEAEEGVLDKWVNLSVVNVSDTDAGLYSCIARNLLDEISANVTLVLPEVVTATTLSKSETGLVWWMCLVVGIAVLISASCTFVAVCCVRAKAVRHRKNLKTSVSFTDQEKKLLDVSIATTTDRGTGSCEAIGPVDLELLDTPPVHITIESEPVPIAAVYPPPPAEFSSNALPPTGPYGNIFISVSVSRDPNIDATSRCPDLLDLSHRGGGASVAKPIYHGMATLPRRLPTHHTIKCCLNPQYDNMGPRVTMGGGSSTLSLPEEAEYELHKLQLALPPPPPTPPQQTSIHHLQAMQSTLSGTTKLTIVNPEFVSL